MKRVVVVHGWEGTPQSNWFSWLADMLEQHIEGVEVEVPQMPHADHPVLGEWLAALEALVGMPDASTYFVGHSLGVIAILRYIETLPAGTKVGGIVSVAGFAESVGIEETATFFEVPVDFKKVREACDTVIVIDSDDDPYVPLERGDRLARELGARRVTVPGGRHFSGVGWSELPAAYEALAGIMQSDSSDTASNR